MTLVLLSWDDFGVDRDASIDSVGDGRLSTFLFRRGRSTIYESLNLMNWRVRGILRLANLGRCVDFWRSFLYSTLEKQAVHILSQPAILPGAQDISENSGGVQANIITSSTSIHLKNLSV